MLDKLAVEWEEVEGLEERKQKAAVAEAKTEQTNKWKIWII